MMGDPITDLLLVLTHLKMGQIGKKRLTYTCSIFLLLTSEIQSWFQMKSKHMPCFNVSCLFFMISVLYVVCDILRKNILAPETKSLLQNFSPW